MSSNAIGALPGVAPMAFEETISAECTTKIISIFAVISICYKTTYNNDSHLP